MAKDNKSRAFALILYINEDESHFKAFMQIRKLYKYAFITHDSDIYEEETEEHAKGELKKEHIHVVIKFENARHKSKIAKEIGIEENYIQKANFIAYTRYLIHKDDPQKYQYDKKDIYTNMKEEVTSALNYNGNYKRFNTAIMLDKIQENRLKTFYELAMWAKENGQLEEITQNAYFYKNLLYRG